MEKKKESSVNLLAGKINFDGTEPMWIRILIIAMVAAFLLLVLHYAGVLSLPAIMTGKSIVTKVYKAIKGGAP